jgi:hypothetical protein
MLDFYNDIERGKIGENIFKDDFLEFLNIEYENVTGNQAFQVIDSDFITKIGLYEVKTNYKDNEILIFEDYTNINIDLSKKSLGWVYKTKADVIVFVSKKTRDMIFLPFNEKFKKHYDYIRKNTTLEKNQISTKGNEKWQSAFRRVSFELLKGYITYFKKI